MWNLNATHNCSHEHLTLSFSTITDSEIEKIHVKIVSRTQMIPLKSSLRISHTISKRTLRKHTFSDKEDCSPGVKLFMDYIQRSFVHIGRYSRNYTFRWCIVSRLHLCMQKFELIWCSELSGEITGACSSWMIERNITCEYENLIFYKCDQIRCSLFLFRSRMICDIRVFSGVLHRSFLSCGSLECIAVAMTFFQEFPLDYCQSLWRLI